jgi:hypothetical protein
MQTIAGHEWREYIDQQIKSGAIDRSLEERFQGLATWWREDNRFTSSVTKLVMHQAYQQIIGMGPAAIPLILRELQRNPDHWFWALTAITGENPVEPEDAGHLQAMTRAWLQWGDKRGYI